MSKSFIAGSVTGVTLSVFGLAAASLMAPPVTQDVADAASTDVAAIAAETTTENSSTAAMPETAESSAETAPGAGSEDVAGDTPPAEPLVTLEVPEGSEFGAPKTAGEALLPSQVEAPAIAEAPAPSAT
ncbi:MAG: hypothetical protein WBA91_06730, partial [Paracoccaceae bacterium]